MDDFGFQDYIQTVSVEALPATEDPTTFVSFDSKKLRRRAIRSLVAASGTMFICSIAIALSSDRLDGWRSHALGTARVSAVFFAGSVAWRVLDGKD